MCTNEHPVNQFTVLFKINTGAVDSDCLLTKTTYCLYIQDPSPVPDQQQEEGASGDSSGTVSVPDPELLIKHPLHNKWALWYFKNDKTKDWISNLKLITAFDTVEDFWA